MRNLLAIKLKALFLLTVFAANLIAVCHCRHTLSQGDQAAKQKAVCCSGVPKTDETCAAGHKPCDEKDGCCGTHVLQFGLLEKQTADAITLRPLYAVALAHSFIFSLETLAASGHAELRIGEEWLHKHPPPDFQSLYQRYLI